MAIEEALTSLLSGVASGRRHWGRAPQGVTVDDGAFLVLNNITKARDYHMKGPSGYVPARFQIDAYAATFTGARDAAAAVVTALSGHSGTTAGTTIQAIFIEGPRSLPAEDEGEVTFGYRQSLDALVHYIE